MKKITITLLLVAIFAIATPAQTKQSAMVQPPAFTKPIKVVRPVPILGTWLKYYFTKFGGKGSFKNPSF